MKRSKEIKGFVLGVIVFAVIAGTIVYANPIVKEIVYGVRVNLNGSMIDFDDDMHPFIMDGRTFLPLREIARLSDFSVSFHDNVVYLTSADGGFSDIPPVEVEIPVATPAPPVVTDNAYEFEREVFRLVNEERANAGLPALQWNDSLAAAARSHSTDMRERDYFSHTGLDGTTVSDRVTMAGYSWRYVGENIAFGQRTPAQVMDSWMNSQGHRDNILDSDYVDIGVGFDGFYWTLVFGGR